METYHSKRYLELLSKETDFVQDNMSFSRYGTIRGLHYQTGIWSQAKLVRCTQGTVLDVVVDIRPKSETYLKHYSLELSDSNHLQLYVPGGFAHGFAVLSKYAIVEYKCDNYYNPHAEAGIRFDDPAVGIDWPIPPERIVVSPKDLQYGPID